MATLMSPPPPPPPPPPPLLLPPHAATPNAASGVMQTMATTLRSLFISLPVARLWVDSHKAVRLFIRLSCHLGGKIPDGNSTVFAHLLCSVWPCLQAQEMTGSVNFSVFRSERN